MRRRHVIGVHRISSNNNALAWHYAMPMSVMMIQITTTQQTRTVAADRQQQRGRAD
jgi:hypothetical protein